MPTSVLDELTIPKYIKRFIKSKRHVSFKQTQEVIQFDRYDTQPGDKFYDSDEYKAMMLKNYIETKNIKLDFDIGKTYEITRTNLMRIKVTITVKCIGYETSHDNIYYKFKMIKLKPNNTIENTKLIEGGFKKGKVLLYTAKKGFVDKEYNSILTNRRSGASITYEARKID